MEDTSVNPTANGNVSSCEDYIIEHPKQPDIAVPANTYYFEYILEKLDRHGDMVALINAVNGASTSYAELRLNILAFAFGLQKCFDYAPLDCVLLILPNGPEFIVVQHGTLAACGRVSATSYLNGPHEIDHCLTVSKPRVMVISSDKLSMVTKVLTEKKNAGQLTTPFNLVVVNVELNSRHTASKPTKTDEQSNGETDGVKVMSFKELLETGKTVIASKFQNDLKQAAKFCVDRQHKFVNIKTDWVALYYSSGTTGLPKGVMHSNTTLLAANLATNAAVKLELGERIQAILPFNHMFGNLAFVMSTVSQAATLVYRSAFDKDRFFSDIADFKIRTSFAVPPLILLFTQDDTCLQYDLSSLQRVYCSAAPLSAETERMLYKKLNNVQILQLYGLSECGGQIVSPSDADRAKPHKMGTIGCVYPGVRAKIVDLHDPSKTIGKPGERGNLALKSPCVMLGYLDNDEATRELIPYNDGWIHTGDIAYFDDDHYFYIIDRMKEMIKYKGHQIAPAELEAVLLTQPGVADAAVIGVPAPGEDGQYPFAFVVATENDHDLNAEKLAESVSKRVAAYKKLRARHVAFVDNIPKSPAGKILRRELREKYCTGRVDNA